jgi:hypothetical protein
LLIIPLIVALFAAGVWGVGHACAWAVPWRELGMAAALCAVSGELSLIPALRTHRNDPVAMAQAALIGTVAHMVLTLVLAAGAWSARLVPLERHAFIYMLLVFYWVSLIGLVIALARILRGLAASKPQTAGGKLS